MHIKIYLTKTFAYLTLIIYVKLMPNNSFNTFSISFIIYLLIISRRLLIIHFLLLFYRNIEPLKTLFFQWWIRGAVTLIINPYRFFEILSKHSSVFHILKVENWTVETHMSGCPRLPIDPDWPFTSNRSPRIYIDTLQIDGF